MSLVSIVVPVYKVEKYLQRCVDSLIKQTFADFDLILVDDGSPDQCGLICDQYEKADGRIKVIHQKNCGLSAARNTGIEWSLLNSESKWITFVDSDDWVHPQYLEILYESAVKHKTDISICAFKEVVNETFDQSKKYYIDTVSEWNPEDFFVTYNLNATVAWAKLYKKEYFNTMRYPLGKIHEDEFVTYQLLFQTKKISLSNLQLYYYFFNQFGIMQTESNKKRMDGLEAYLQQINYFDKNNFIRAKKTSVRGYVAKICSWISEVDTYNKRERKRLRKNLKQALKSYNDLVPFTDCRWAYQVAFPIRVKCYGIAERIYNKVIKKW